MLNVEYLITCFLVVLQLRSYHCTLYEPLFVGVAQELFLSMCDKVYLKQKVSFILYLLVQTVTWQYTCNHNPLDYNWPYTVINNHDWQLRNCPFLIWSLSCKANACWTNHYYYVLRGGALQDSVYTKRSGCKSGSSYFWWECVPGWRHIIGNM